ncbi:MAG: AAA family ATPase, partial [Chloroflexi bacterium]|nr:AAA family ATPase [Chloroflexota bacterium]
PEQARFRLFDSITSFLKNASQSQPLMLVLDDLHWADKPSLLLLQFLARELASAQPARLLVVCCYRDVELSRQHPLSETLAQLSRSTEGGFQRILLRGLAPEDTARIIEARAGVKPTKEMAEAIHSRTEGNPFFMTEVIRLLSESGELSAGRLSTPEALRIPEGVREVIGQRLNRLSAQCNDVLTTASIIGREFDFRLLSALNGGATDEQLLQVLEEALAARVIEELPRSMEGYQFTHALVQETLASELSAARQVRLHTRIAQALEELYKDDLEDHANELARHFTEAEPVLGAEKLVHYSRLAGEGALGVYAWEKAEVHFQRALDAKHVSLGGRKPALDAETAELLHGLGRAQLAMLRVDEGWTTLGRAFDYYAEVGDLSRIVAIADYPIDIQVPGDVAPLLTRALDLAPPDSYEAGRLLPWHGRLLGTLQGDYDGAQEALSRALVIAQREGDTALELQTLAYAAEVAGFYLRWDQCLEKALQAVDLTGHNDNALAENIAHKWAAISLAAMGHDSERVRRHALASLAAAERLHDRVFLPRTLGVVCNVFSAWGDWQTARELSGRGLALAPRSQSVLPVRTLLEYQVGAFDQGEAYLELDQELIRLTDHGTSPRRASMVLSIVARITGESADLDIAEEAAEAVLSSSSATPIFTYAANLSLGLIAVQRGDVAAAAEQYSALGPYRGTMMAPMVWWTSADRLLGLLSETMGNSDQAAGHFEDAMVFCRKAGYRPELAWSCCDYADLLLAGARHAVPVRSDRAISLLEESLAIATEFGMRPLIERVNERLERARALPETAPAYPDGLSQREVEVLCLVAAGKTNLEIAEALVIAEGTARRHVANIYEKIGAANRAEATGYALRERLLSLDETQSAQP